MYKTLHFVFHVVFIRKKTSSPKKTPHDANDDDGSFDHGLGSYTNGFPISRCTRRKGSYPREARPNALQYSRIEENSDERCQLRTLPLTRNMAREIKSPGSSSWTFRNPLSNLSDSLASLIILYFVRSQKKGNSLLTKSLRSATRGSTFLFIYLIIYFTLI